MKTKSKKLHEKELFEMVEAATSEKELGDILRQAKKSARITHLNLEGEELEFMDIESAHLLMKLEEACSIKRKAFQLHKQKGGFHAL